jgi:hypothetical protein
VEESQVKLKEKRASLALDNRAFAVEAYRTLQQRARWHREDEHNRTTRPLLLLLLLLEWEGARLETPDMLDPTTKMTSK